ncbi:follistatin [Bicyclus anynana]|uniref:Follistatin n=1 Tax=Bicyclus anynana TaxID=110368 RepID=A0A6J1P1S7_BICAN|nr:follistatin [Bicyclus anynana]
MKDLIPVIFIVIACNQKVLSRSYRDVVDDNAILYAESQFYGPYSSDRNAPLRQVWGLRELGDYDSSDEDDYHRVVFPDTDSRDRHTSSQTNHRNLRQCIASCEPSSEYQQVCGTDGVTYQNLEQLQCFMRCGVDVRIRQLSPCSGWSTTSRPATTTTLSSHKACMATCPTTSEYNPVCGSDHVTYNNHGKLMCAQNCGKDVQVKRRSPCPNIKSTADPRTTSTTTPRSTKQSIAVSACITTCPSTSEYQPVCGTNNETYFNLSRLQCAMYCGVDVSLLKSVPCHLEDNSHNEENDDEDIDVRIPKL